MKYVSIESMTMCAPMARSNGEMSCCIMWRLADVHGANDWQSVEVADAG